MGRQAVNRPVGIAFNVGDWVKVPVNDFGGYNFLAGPVVYVNDRFFVMRSAVGGFTISFDWIEAANKPQSFKKIDASEAHWMLSDRLLGREFVV